MVNYIQRNPIINKILIYQVLSSVLADTHFVNFVHLFVLLLIFWYPVAAIRNRSLPSAI